MIITRSEAILLASFYKLFNLESKQANDLIETALVELDIVEAREEERNKYLREYIERQFECYTNEYIRLFLGRHIPVDIEIAGSAPPLERCACCGYMALSPPVEYTICPVCFWENDGIRTDEDYSDVNRMTLGEARAGFSLFGAVNEGSVRFLDQDRFLQFGK